MSGVVLYINTCIKSSTCWNSFHLKVFHLSGNNILLEIGDQQQPCSLQPCSTLLATIFYSFTHIYRCMLYIFFWESDLHTVFLEILLISICLLSFYFAKNGYQRWKESLYNIQKYLIFNAIFISDHSSKYNKY